MKANMKRYISRPCGMLVIAIAVSALGGCSKDKNELATVNGERISTAQFEAFLKTKRISRDNDALVKRSLDSYLEQEALTTAILDADKAIDDAVINAELREVRKQLVINKYFDRYLDQSVTDAAIDNYYNNHLKDYSSRKVHVAHILVRTSSKTDEKERLAKLGIAKAVFDKASTGGDFAELAKQYSEDTISAGKNGDLGWLVEGAIDQQFSEVAFGLKPGQVSEPVSTVYGFHVIKLIEGPEVVQQPLDKVRGNIRHLLREQAKTAELERLLKSVKVERFDDKK